MTARNGILGCALVLSLLALGVRPMAALATARSLPARGPVLVTPSSDPVTDARALAAHGDVGDAIRVLEPYVDSHPRDMDSGRFLGDLLTRAADLPRAERAYLAVLAVSAADRLTHERLGNLYAREDRLDDAIDQYEKTLPDTVAFTDLIRVHKRRGDLTAFVQSYQRDADADPLNGTAQYAYGLIMLDLSKAAQARPYLETAVRINPRSCPALAALGDALVDLDQAPSGIDLLERCLRIDSSDYGALVDLGCALISRDDDRAREELNRAAALYPDRPEAYIDLGYLDDIGGRLADSSDLYVHAIALDPFARNAYVNLGYNQYKSGRLADAEKTLLRGLSASSDDGRLEFILGETLERLGKRDLARREYQSATRSDEPEIAQAAAKKLAFLTPVP